MLDAAKSRIGSGTAALRRRIAGAVDRIARAATEQARLAAVGIGVQPVPLPVPVRDRPRRPRGIY